MITIYDVSESGMERLNKRLGDGAYYATLSELCPELYKVKLSQDAILTSIVGHEKLGIGYNDKATFLHSNEFVKVEIM